MTSLLLFNNLRHLVQQGAYTRDDRKARMQLLKEERGENYGEVSTPIYSKKDGYWQAKQDAVLAKNSEPDSDIESYHTSP